jgi:hypothetical protein
MSESTIKTFLAISANSSCRWTRGDFHTISCANSHDERAKNTVTVPIHNDHFLSQRRWGWFLYAKVMTHSRIQYTLKKTIGKWTMIG